MTQLSMETNTSEDNRPAVQRMLGELQREIDGLDQLIRDELRNRLKFVSLPDIPVPIDPDKSDAEGKPNASDAVLQVTHLAMTVSRMRSELQTLIDRVQI